MTTFRPPMPEKWKMKLEQNSDNTIQEFSIWMNADEEKKFPEETTKIKFVVFVENGKRVERTISPIFVRCSEEEARTNPNAIFHYLNQFLENCEESWWVPEEEKK